MKAVPLTFPLSTLNFKLTRLNFFKWFDNNHVRAHPGKCHLLLSSETSHVLSIGGTTITLSTAETLIVIIIDSEINFEYHLNSVCNKVSRKINALGRVINNYMPP